MFSSFAHGNKKLATLWSLTPELGHMGGTGTGLLFSAPGKVVQKDVVSVCPTNSHPPFPAVDWLILWSHSASHLEHESRYRNVTSSISGRHLEPVLSALRSNDGVDSANEECSVSF